MYFGQCFSSFFGEPEHTIAAMDAYQNGTAIEIVLYARNFALYGSGAPNLADSYFGIYSNCKLVKTVFLADNTTSPIIAFPNSYEPTSIQVISSGWNDNMDQSDIARIQDALTSNKTTISWQYGYEIMPLICDDGSPASASSLTLTGLQPGMSSPLSVTRRQFPFTITSDNTNATFTAGSITGTGLIGEVINLSDGNGVTGTVIIYTNYLNESGTLTYRYPASTTITRNGSEVGTINFSGNASGSFTDSTLSSGNYDYYITDTSDTGVVGTPQFAGTAFIPVVPEPVTDLAYVSGTNGDTNISWTASPTPNVVYNVYLGRYNTDYINTVVPYMTTSGTTANITEVSATGLAEIMVRAQSLVSGLEEKNPYVLEIEYDPIYYVPPRPNVARITDFSNTGLDVSIKAYYSSEGAVGTAATIQLFVAEPANDFNTEFPVDEQPIVDGVANLNYTGTTGWWKFMVLASTAGGTQSGANSNETQLYLSETSTTPANIVLTNSRG